MLVLVGECADLLLAGGGAWSDADGDGCAMYLQYDYYCGDYGDSPGSEGLTGSAACCACGGGAAPAAIVTAEPTAKPTTEPTAKPTTEPTAKPTTEPTKEPTTAKPTAEPNVIVLKEGPAAPGGCSPRPHYFV